MMFKIGDKVEILEGLNEELTGLKGVIIAEADRPMPGVEFSNKIAGHCCDGKGKAGHCYWVYRRFLKKIPATLTNK